MAPEDVEQFTRWDYVPDQQAFIIPGAPQETATSIDEISEGRIYQRGDTLFRSSDRSILGRVSSIRGSVLQAGNKGTLLLSNRTTLERVLDPRSTSSLPQLEITGGLEALGIDLPEDVSRIISLASRTSVVYINENQTTGRTRYTTVSRGLFGEQGPPLVNEFGRLAGPEDLVLRSIAGWLAKNASSVLERARTSGVTLPDGSTTTDGSEIVRAIAANISVSPVITYVLSQEL